MKKQTFNVEKETELLPFLLDNLDRGRNYVKGVLKRGQVLIDGETETQFDTELVSGQTVDVLSEAPVLDEFSGVEILFEDDDLIVINKEAGLLSVSTRPGDRKPTAYREVTAYMKQLDPRSRIFIVHRLDRDTSGVMVFAKNEHTKFALQKNWHDIVKERSYMALVEGKMDQQEDTITSWLKETKTHQVYAVKDSVGAKKAILNYSVVEQSNRYALLKVELETGRKNQIRVQLADINHPIVGDKQYGAKSNPIARLGLHAHALAFKHPTTKQMVRYEAPLPANFKPR